MLHTSLSVRALSTYVSTHWIIQTALLVPRRNMFADVFRRNASHITISQRSEHISGPPSSQSSIWDLTAIALLATRIRSHARLKISKKLVTKKLKMNFLKLTLPTIATLCVGHSVAPPYLEIVS
ncbi:hypothetical protein J6590_106131, partial [Homalodisca vitripennis]